MKTQKKKLSSLTMFFPAYNEAGNIEEVIEQALLVLPQVAQKYELLIINDGSTDATLQIAKRISKKYKKIRVINQRNRGYGGALKRGFKEARYEWVFFSDSDLQFNLMELKKFIPHQQQNKIIVGFRQNRADGFSRILLAKALKLWNFVFLGFPHTIRDIDCAFKLIHADVLRSVKPLLSDGAMISTELLLKSYRNGYTVRQIGVEHFLRMHGSATGNSSSVIVRAISDTFKLQNVLLKQRISSTLKSLYLPLPIPFRSLYTK